MKKIFILFSIFVFLFSLSFAQCTEQEHYAYMDCIAAGGNEECVVEECQDEYISYEYWKQIVEEEQAYHDSVSDENYNSYLDSYNDLVDCIKSVCDPDQPPEDEPYIYDEELVKEQLKKDFHECVFAVTLYRYLPLHAGLEPKYYDDISDNPGLAVPKWLWKSGCTAESVAIPADLCLAQHCVTNYKIPLENMGGSVTPNYDKFKNSLVNELEGGAIEVSYGSIHTYEPGTTVVLPNGATYQQSEAVITVHEDGSAEIFLLEGELTYITFEDYLSTHIDPGEKIEVDSSGETEVQSFDESELEKWWIKDLCSPAFVLLFISLFLFKNHSGGK